MVNEPSKILLTVSALALAGVTPYTLLTGDHLGIALIVALSLVSAFVGISVAATRDQAAVAAPGVAAPGQVEARAPGTSELRPVRPARPAGGGAWPLFCALAVALVVLSLVTSPLVAGAGAALGLVVLVGWLANVAADRSGRAVNLMPVGIPVVGFFAIASLMFLMSRILLAVPEMASTWIALAVAAVILAVASLIALRPSISNRTIVAGLALGGVLMLVGGFVAAAVGERHIEHHGPAGHEADVEIAADNLQFDLAEFQLPPATEVNVEFRNEETAPHNVAIYTDESAAQPIFVGDVVVGPISITYAFTSPGPGSYFFRCDIHPNMRGTVRVA
jgi:plastocyanin